MLEDLKPLLKKSGDAARAQLISQGIQIAPRKGFKGDLFDVLVAREKSLTKILSAITPVPATALNLVSQTDTLMAEVAGRKINDQLIWPYPAPTTLGLEALKIAQNELRLWDSASFEQKMQAIFKYLGNDSEYENWCAGFVSWCLDNIPDARWAGKDVEKQSSLGALRLFSDFETNPKTKKFTFTASTAPAAKPGDIVFWKRANAKVSFAAGFGHVGFVFSVKGEDVTTLEGNNSMSVTLSAYKDGFNKSSKHRFHGVVRLP